MTSIIYWKLRSQISYSTVLFDGHFVSLGEAKRLIAAKQNIADPNELLLTNAQTQTEYRDDSEQLPKGTCVTVKRVPAGTAQRGKPRPLLGATPVLTAAAAQPAPAPPPADSRQQQPTAGGQDDEFGGNPFTVAAAQVEAQRMAAAAAAAQHAQAAGAGPGRGGRGGAMGGRGRGRGYTRPYPHYICPRCAAVGQHWQDDCPTQGDDTFNVRRVFRAAGIPMSKITSAKDGSMVLGDGKLGEIATNNAVFQQFAAQAMGVSDVPQGQAALPASQQMPMLALTGPGHVQQPQQHQLSQQQQGAQQQQGVQQQQGAQQQQGIQQQQGMQQQGNHAAYLLQPQQGRALPAQVYAQTHPVPPTLQPAQITLSQTHPGAAPLQLQSVLPPAAVVQSSPATVALPSPHNQPDALQPQQQQQEAMSEQQQPMGLSVPDPELTPPPGLFDDEDDDALNAAAQPVTIAAPVPAVHTPTTDTATPTLPDNAPASTTQPTDPSAAPAAQAAPPAAASLADAAVTRAESVTPDEAEAAFISAERSALPEDLKQPLFTSPGEFLKQLPLLLDLLPKASPKVLVTAFGSGLPLTPTEFRHLKESETARAAAVVVAATPAPSSSAALPPKPQHPKHVSDTATVSTNGAPTRRSVPYEDSKGKEQRQDSRGGQHRERERERERDKAHRKGGHEHEGGGSHQDRDKHRDDSKHRRRSRSHSRSRSRDRAHSSSSTQPRV